MDWYARGNLMYEIEDEYEREDEMAEWKRWEETA